MANQEIGGMKTLAQTQDVEDSTNKVLIDMEGWKNARLLKFALFETFNSSYNI